MLGSTVRAKKTDGKKEKSINEGAHYNLSLEIEFLEAKLLSIQNNRHNRIWCISKLTHNRHWCSFFFIKHNGDQILLLSWSCLTSMIPTALTHQWQEAKGSYKPASIKQSVTFQTLLTSRLRCVHSQLLILLTIMYACTHIQLNEPLGCLIKLIGININKIRYNFKFVGNTGNRTRDKSGFVDLKG